MDLGRFAVGEVEKLGLVGVVSSHKKFAQNGLNESI